MISRKLDMPLVSIVIPTYNRMHRLEECLHALIHQTYPYLEIIIVDDGSTDATRDYVEEFQHKHPGVPLRIVGHETNCGISAARNTGIMQSAGEYIAFTDSDAIVNRDWVEQLTSGFLSDKVMAVTGLTIDYSSENIYEICLKGTSRCYGNPDAKRIVGNNMCFRSSMLREYHFDEHFRFFCDDDSMFLLIRALGYRQVFNEHAIVHHYHYHDMVSFIMHAVRMGASAARLLYKYYLFPRGDIAFLMLGYALLPLWGINIFFIQLSTFFFIGEGGAVAYNELFLKKKNLRELCLSFPLLVLYYHIKMITFVWNTLLLYVFPNTVKRISLKNIQYT